MSVRHPVPNRSPELLMTPSNIHGGPDFEKEDFELKAGKASHVPTFAPRKRPAAFRPLLMEGLALSGEPVQLLFFISENVEFVNQKKAL
jgi:hypothetical protein